jgi:WD40 repeat protein/serine/threonine protein kinase
MGQWFDHYEVIDSVRTDSCFAVYHALDQSTSQPVLLWHVFPGRIPSEIFAAALLERLRQLQLLEQSNLLPILAYGKTDDRLYWITPRVEGVLLEDVLAESRSEAAAARIAAQAAAALDYLHQQNFLHAGLAPANIYLAADERVVLCNYCIVDLLNDEVARAVPEQMLGIGVGAPAYLAPEQIAGRETSPQTDLFALGALYFALLNGQPPFHGGTLAETVVRQMSAPLAWPGRAGQRRISQASIRLVHRCMAKQARDRLDNAAQAHSMLENLARRRWVRVPIRKILLQGAPRPSPWPLRLILLTLIVVFGGWLVYSQAGGWIKQMQLQTVVSALTPVSSATLPPTTKTAAPPTPTQVPVPTVQAEPSVIQIPQPQTTPSLILPVLLGTQIPGEPQVFSVDNVALVQESRRLGYGKFNQAVFSPDGNIIAVASSAGVYLIADKQIIQFLDPQDEAVSLAFSTIGDVLAVGLRNGDIQLWDWRTQSRLAVLSGHFDRVNRLLFSPTQNYLFSASKDKRIKVWDIDNRTEAATWSLHESPVNDIAISSDGKFLVSGGDDQKLIVWEINNAQASKRKIFPHSFKIQAVALFQKGNDLIVAAGGDTGLISQWNARTNLRWTDDLVVKVRVLSLAYNLQGNTLIVGVDEGKFKSVDARRGIYRVPERTFIVPTLSVELRSRLGDELQGFLVYPIFSSYTAVGGKDNQTASISWDGKLGVTGQTAYNLHLPYESFNRLAFSPDSRYLLAGGKLDHVFLWNAVENTLVRVDNAIVPPGSPFSNTSQQVVLVVPTTIPASTRGAQPRTVQAARRFGLPGLTPAGWLSEYPRGALVSFLHDDTLLAAVSASQTRLWDTASGLEAHLRNANLLGCRLLRSQNDDQLFSIYAPGLLSTEQDSRSDQMCKMADTLRGRLAALSPDRRWLAVVETGSQLKLFDLDLASNRPVWTNKSDQTVTALAFSPTGAILLAGDSSGGLAFWETASGAQLVHRPGHFAAVGVVVFSPDGRRAASGGMDGTVRIWEVR